MKKICSLTALLLLLVATAQCQDNKKDLRHLQYGSHKQNNLDLFLPAKYNTKTPVLIMLHGGAWMMGGNEYTDKTARDLRDSGFVVANVDYRYVSDSVHCGDLLNDIDSAIAYLKKVSSAYHFGSGKYNLAGISAGAHLALLYGYTTRRNIRSIAALCAPSRFDDAATVAHLKQLQLTKNVSLLADDTIHLSGNQSRRFTLISPYARIKNIPALLVHGDKDELVPYQQSASLYKLLRDKKIPSKLITMYGKGHDAGMNQPDSEQQVLNAITQWIRRYN